MNYLEPTHFGLDKPFFELFIAFEFIDTTRDILDTKRSGK